MSLPPSRKTSYSHQRSFQEQFYQTRQLFKRNQKYIPPLLKSQNTNQNITYDPEVNDQFKQTHNQSFDKFFSSSAQKQNFQIQNDFLKTRSRLYDWTQNASNDRKGLGGMEWKCKGRNELWGNGSQNDGELSQEKTVDIGKKTLRNFKVFECNLVDKVYDKSYISKDMYQFNQTDYKCLVDLQKERLDRGRKFYFSPHKSQLAENDVDADKVMKGKDSFSPFIKKGLVKLNKITGRERPSSQPFNLLKNIENYYDHEDKSKCKPNNTRMLKKI